MERIHSASIELVTHLTSPPHHPPIIGTTGSCQSKPRVEGPPGHKSTHSRALLASTCLNSRDTRRLHSRKWSSIPTKYLLCIVPSSSSSRCAVKHAHSSTAHLRPDSLSRRNSYPARFCCSFSQFLFQFVQFVFISVLLLICYGEWNVMCKSNDDGRPKDAPALIAHHIRILH